MPTYCTLRALRRATAWLPYASPQRNRRCVRVAPFAVELAARNHQVGLHAAVRIAHARGLSGAFRRHSAFIPPGGAAASFFCRIFLLDFSRRQRPIGAQELMLKNSVLR